jgi:hypothetical protein
VDLQELVRVDDRTQVARLFAGDTDVPLHLTVASRLPYEYKTDISDLFS